MHHHPLSIITYICIESKSVCVYVWMMPVLGRGVNLEG